MRLRKFSFLAELRVPIISIFRVLPVYYNGIQLNFLSKLFIWLPTSFLLNGWSALERTLLK